MTEVVRLLHWIQTNWDEIRAFYFYLYQHISCEAFNFWTCSRTIASRMRCVCVIGSFYIWFLYSHWKWKCWKAFIEYIGRNFFANIRLRLFFLTMIKMVYSVQYAAHFGNNKNSRTKEGKNSMNRIDEAVIFSHRLSLLYELYDHQKLHLCM